MKKRFLNGKTPKDLNFHHKSFSNKFTVKIQFQIAEHIKRPIPCNLEREKVLNLEAF